MEGKVRWVLLGLVVSLAVKGGRGRLWGWGGGEEGECHFWSHSAIQRKLFLKTPGCKGRKLVFCRAQGSARVCWAQWTLPTPGFPPPRGQRPRTIRACQRHPVRKQGL